MTWLVQFLFSFKGRINRAKYWAFVGSAFALYVVMVPFVVYGLVTEDVPNRAAYTLAIVFPVLLVFFICSLAINLKRLHDRNKGAEWLVPFVVLPDLFRGVSNIAPNGSPEATGLLLLSLPFTLWAFVELGFLRGTDGPNRYGTDPLEGPSRDVATVFE